MAYASYDYYIREYYGKAITSCEEFNRLAERASEYIDTMTMYRAKTFNDSDGQLKKACCAVAEIVFREENGGLISSETIGSHTVSYIKGATADKTEEQRVYYVIMRYLLHTGLLYCGMG